MIATGTPEDVAKNAKSYTGQFVKPLLERAKAPKRGAGSRGLQRAAAPPA